MLLKLFSCLVLSREPPRALMSEKTRTQEKYKNDETGSGKAKSTGKVYIAQKSSR